jgi:hypothetical protein
VLTSVHRGGKDAVYTRVTRTGGYSARDSETAAVQALYLAVTQRQAAEMRNVELLRGDYPRAFQVENWGSQTARKLSPGQLECTTFIKLDTALLTR